MCDLIRVKCTAQSVGPLTLTFQTAGEQAPDLSVIQEPRQFHYSM